MTHNLYKAHSETAPGGRAMGDAVPGLAHLLASALATCVLKNVECFNHMAPFEYAGASVDVELAHQDGPPWIVRASYQLVVDAEEPAARCSLLHKNIRKSGTLSNTLALAFSGSKQARRAGGDVEEIDSTSPHEA